MRQWLFNLYIKTKRLETDQWQSSQSTCVDDGAAQYLCSFPRGFKKDQRTPQLFCQSFIF